MSLAKRICSGDGNLLLNSTLAQSGSGGEVGELLIRLQDNLRKIKNEVTLINGCDAADKVEKLRDIIERTEVELIDGTEKLVRSTNTRALQIQFPGKQVDVEGSGMTQGHERRLLVPLSKTGPGKPSPGKQLKELHRLKAVINPRHKDARKILHEAYKVPLPAVKDSRDKVAALKTSSIKKFNPRALPPMSSNKFSVNKQDVVELCIRQQEFLQQPPTPGEAGVYRSAAEHGEGETENVFITSMADNDQLEKQRPISHITHSTGKTSSLALVPLPTPVTERTGTSKLVIYKGKLTATSCEYEQFRKYYNTSWGPISAILFKLEKLSQDYHIPVAFIDTDALVDLALYFEEKLQPSMIDLLTCLLNREDVEKLLLLPGRRYLASDGPEKAATKIQATYRCYKKRALYLKHRRQNWAAGLIALSWIMTCKRTLIRKQLKESKIAQLQRFRLRWANFRKNWNKIKGTKRTIIHTPSLGFDQRVRQTCSDISSLENYQITRVFDLDSGNSDVIYISPLHISEEVQEYYAKILSLSGIEANCNDKIPFKFVVPEAINHFPTHNMCLSTILKYSPRTLIRIRNMIKGKVAYIVPGIVNQDDLYASDLLDIPVLGSEPEISRLYSMKSGRRRIFENANVDCCPGEYDVYNLTRLHEALARLVTENLDINCWYFKIDDEFNGRGTAYCMVTDHLKCYSLALRERQRYGGKWPKKWAWEPTYMKILAEIPEILANYAVPLNGALYGSWESFLEHYLSRGGVIEGAPPSDSTTIVCVDVLIEPTGNISILSSADQIHSSSTYQCLGYSIPQLSTEPAPLIESTGKIASACLARGIFGYINVSFITFIDPETGEQVLWALNLKLCYSECLSMVKLLEFLTNGTIDPTTSTFKVPIVDKRELKCSRRRAKEGDLAKSRQWKVVDRYAIVSSRLYHSDMTSVRYGVLFQLCKSLGIGYDKELHTGTLFNLLDEKRRERFGMIVLGESLQESISMFAFNANEIHRQIKSPHIAADTNILETVNVLKDILQQTDQNLQQAEGNSDISRQIFCNNRAGHCDTNVVQRNDEEIASSENNHKESDKDIAPHPSPISEPTNEDAKA